MKMFWKVKYSSSALAVDARARSRAASVIAFCSEPKAKRLPLRLT